MGYEENRIVRDLHGKYFFSRDVIFNKMVPGYLSPCRGIPVDFTSLPLPSIIPDNDPNALPLLSSTSTLHTSTTPLYHPTLSDTIRNRDALVDARTQRITRTNTNSLPKPHHHYNDIHMITSFISINEALPSDISPHSFDHTNYHDLFNFSFLSSPLPFY